MGRGLTAVWGPLIALLGMALPLDMARAQVTPDAGAALRQTDRDRTTPLPAAVPALPSAPPSATPLGETTVQVNRFTFRGNRLLSDEQLAEAVAPFVDRPLRLNDLQAATAAVAARYRDAGWLARAVLPRQEIADGVVTIRIVEAVFGKVQVQPRSAGLPATAVSSETYRVDLDVLAARVLARQGSGDPLRLPALERGLLLGNDLPGIEMSGSLVSGDNDGTTDLLLNIADKPLFAGEVSADNEGARSFGSERANARIGVASPLGLGDEINAQVQVASGIRYARVGASVPLGSDGLRAGASVSGLRYKVRDDTFSAIAPSGSAGGGSLDLGFPLLRAHDHNLYLAAVRTTSGSTIARCSRRPATTVSTAPRCASTAICTTASGWAASPTRA